MNDDSKFETNTSNFFKQGSEAKSPFIDDIKSRNSMGSLKSNSSQSVNKYLVKSKVKNIDKGQ